jgi:hypothetical protein
MHLPSKPILLVMVLTSMRPQPSQQPSTSVRLRSRARPTPHCRKLDPAGLQVYERERRNFYFCYNAGLLNSGVSFECDRETRGSDFRYYKNCSASK